MGGRPAMPALAGRPDSFFEGPRPAPPARIHMAPEAPQKHSEHLTPFFNKRRSRETTSNRLIDRPSNNIGFYIQIYIYIYIYIILYIVYKILYKIWYGGPARHARLGRPARFFF